MATATLLRGWIVHSEDESRESAEEFLTELGIELCGYYAETCEFIDCALTEEALRRLTPHWGRFIWGLERI